MFLRTQHTPEIPLRSAPTLLVLCSGLELCSEKAAISSGVATAAGVRKRGEGVGAEEAASQSASIARALLPPRLFTTSPRLSSQGLEVAALSSAPHPTPLVPHPWG